MSELEREMTEEEEQELLRLLDEELKLPPLPPDFVSNVLARLGLPPLQPGELEILTAEENVQSSPSRESRHRRTPFWRRPISSAEPSSPSRESRHRRTPFWRRPISSESTQDTPESTEDTTEDTTERLRRASPPARDKP